jgi:hypothetical protein
MVTGIECAGLVLAVLPLFVEAGPAYSHGLDSILDVSSQKNYDEALEDFYYEFFWAISELQIHATAISNAASPGPTKTQSSSALHLNDWSHDSEVEKQLRLYFGSDTDFNRFVVTAKRIVKLLSQLLAPSAASISKTETVGFQSYFQ